MQYGLIGYPLTHSHSLKFFNEKFASLPENNHNYALYPLKNLSEFDEFINKIPDLAGLNVTIPHKINIIPFLNEIDNSAKTIGAVNCISIKKKSGMFLKGFNTDAFAFEYSLKPLLKPYHNKALILGNGGSCKSVAFILHKLNISFLIVTRCPIRSNHISYNNINSNVLDNHLLIVNTTPLGMFPDKKSYPDIPYNELTEKHLLFDLIYNPENTVFMQKAKHAGAQVSNGLHMFRMQAEKSLEIWNIF